MSADSAAVGGVAGRGAAPRLRLAAGGTGRLLGGAGRPGRTEEEDGAAEDGAAPAARGTGAGGH